MKNGPSIRGAVSFCQIQARQDPQSSTFCSTAAARVISSSRWIFTEVGASIPILAPLRSLDRTIIRMPPSMRIASPWRRLRISTGHNPFIKVRGVMRQPLSTKYNILNINGTPTISNVADILEMTQTVI